MLRLALLTLGILFMACDTPGRPEASEARADAQSASWRKPGDVIDSILPMTEYLIRFRRGLTEPVALEGGAASREALAAQFLQDVARRDTASLRRLLITRAEFAWLLFPDHRYAAPPYELDPTIFWMQMTAESGKGLERVLMRYGGQPLELEHVGCAADTLQIRQGSARIWGPCEVRYRTADSTLTRRLFGSMIERDGRVKLMSYANDF